MTHDDEAPHATDASSWTTLRTPHLARLVAALDARELHHHILSVDTVRVEAIDPDDLGWLLAHEGIVVYAMTTED